MKNGFWNHSGLIIESLGDRTETNVTALKIRSAVFLRRPQSTFSALDNQMDLEQSRAIRNRKGTHENPVDKQIGLLCGGR